MSTATTTDKRLRNDIHSIRENMAYIRGALEDLAERAKEDRNTTYAHIQEDHIQFQKINRRLDHMGGGIAVACFLITLAAGLIGFLPGW